MYIFGLLIIGFSYIAVLNSNKHDDNFINIKEINIIHELPKYYATIN